MANDVYSYHTFFFPFIWDEAQDNIDLKQFKTVFERNPHWVCTDMASETYIKTGCQGTSCAAADSGTPQVALSWQDARLKYQEYQYFHPSVRRAIFGFNNNIVNNYTFEPALVRNRAVYRIEKMINQALPADQEPNRYDLIINAINLKIFNTGVAVFCLECENRAYRSLAAVKNINEYGRRINTPFLPADNSGITLTADKLAVYIPGADLKAGVIPRQVVPSNPSAPQPLRPDTYLYFERSYRDFLQGIQNPISDSAAEEAVRRNEAANLRYIEEVSLTYVAGFIKDLLYYGLTDVVIASERVMSPPRGAANYYIYPALDDRMFVGCVVRDKALSDRLIHFKLPSAVLLSNAADLAFARSLYELLYIDADGQISSPTPEFMEIELAEHLYCRWQAYGTIHGVTQQAFVCLTSEQVDDPVVNPCLTQYFQMIILCLAQRASIMTFQRLAAQITEGLEVRRTELSNPQIKLLLDLQERFVAYQNQLQFFEVTSQLQGIELYNMMTKSMYITEERDLLVNQMNNLYEAVNTNQGYHFNKWALLLAIIALGLTAVGSLASVFSYFGCISKCVAAFGLSVACLATLGLFCGFFIKNSRKNARINKHK